MTEIPKGELLTDEQCNEFRRLPCSFNDMVRAIYSAGIAAALLRNPGQAGDHRQGCEALGGYGHGVGPCTCGAQEGEPSDAVSDVLVERRRQDAKWGGPIHDDEHSNKDWLDFIMSQNNRSRMTLDANRRQYFVKIAALAIAAIESIDRKGQAT